jgi:uncharacterized protein (TIGR03083 family)
MTASPGPGHDATTGIDVRSLRPIARPESVTLARIATERMVALLRTLAPDDWTRPTDCPAWDVRATAGHVLGMTETFTSLRRFVATMVAGQRAAGDGPAIDGITAVQVRANAGLSTAQLIDRMAAGGPRQARWRGRRRLMRAIPSTEELPDGGTERWRLAFVLDTILTRDTWMRRVDIARATKRPLELTAEHDGRIIADVVREWADRHGRPFQLRLTGAAGGTYVGGVSAHSVEPVELDAVEFCRIVSGRASGHGLLHQRVPF